MRPLLTCVKHQRNIGFNAAEAGDAVPDRGFEHLAVDVAALLLERVRRVVGRDHVDRAVEQALPQRVLVLLAAHRRVHLQQGSDVLHVGVDAEQIMRLRFGGETQAARLARRGPSATACLVEAWTMCSLVPKVLGKEHDVG